MQSTRQDKLHVLAGDCHTPATSPHYAAPKAAGLLQKIASFGTSNQLSSSGEEHGMRNFSYSNTNASTPKRTTPSLLLRSTLLYRMDANRSGGELKMTKSCGRLEELQKLSSKSTTKLKGTSSSPSQSLSLALVRNHLLGQSGSTNRQPLNASKSCARLEEMRKSSLERIIPKLTPNQAADDSRGEIKKCAKAEEMPKAQKAPGRSTPNRDWTGSSVSLRNALMQRRRSNNLSLGSAGRQSFGSTGKLKTTRSVGKLEDLQSFGTRTEGRSSSKERGSLMLLRNSMNRNGRSGTSLAALAGEIKKTKSCAKLEDMRNTIMSKTSSCGRSLSSQALQAFAKMNASPQSEVVEQDADFFCMIQYNPMNPKERAMYDDLAVKKYIRRHPEALRVKYEFQIGGRGRLTVSRYPLSALVALGASLSVVKLAIKANPPALNPNDFNSTTLHTACSFNTDLEVIRYIYSKYPAAIRETTKLVYLPLHNACQASSEDNPMFEVIQFLVEEYPEGLMAINKLGDTPLRMAQRNGCMPQQVLEYLAKETDRIFSMEENSETFSYVSERQSWGSRELGVELLDNAVLPEQTLETQPFQTSSLTAQ